MLEINLEKIFYKLDLARLALYNNLESYDDERMRTWQDFIKELNELKDLINAVPNDPRVPVVGTIED